MAYLKILILITLMGGIFANGISWFSVINFTDTKIMVPKVNDMLDDRILVPKRTYEYSDEYDSSYLLQNPMPDSDMANFQPSRYFPITSQGAQSQDNEGNSNFHYFKDNGTIKSRVDKKHLLNPKKKYPITSNKSLPRFLEVFEVVEFDHVPCVSTSGLEGTCRHKYDCDSIGGSPMGSCADDFGTCCVITINCESRTASPVGWFINPNFPSPSSERLSCAIIIDKSSTDIVQIRLDFQNFEVLPPTYGTCEQDQFAVTGQDVNNVLPILCGINTGQHIYVEVGNSEGPINLSFQTLSEENRLFSIKVSQLKSSDKLIAPKGCLQYFNEANGYLESFNYRDRSEIGITRIPSYLNNLNYAICIEREPTSCSITYTNFADMQIVNYDSEGLSILPPRQAGVEIFNCPSDWLLISAVRLCGERLNDGSVLQDFSLDAPVTDDGAGPIAVWFRSDGMYSGRGYKLYYQQNSCSAPNAE